MPKTNNALNALTGIKLAGYESLMMPAAPLEAANGGYKESISRIRKLLTAAARNFCEIGYHLKELNRTGGYMDAGYADIWELAENEFGFSKSTASRHMAINDRFSEGGDSPRLAAEYSGFSKSQLQEMLYLPEPVVESVDPGMPVGKIRSLKPKKERIEALPCENGDAGAGDGGQLPGQMNVADYPEVIPSTMAMQGAEPTEGGGGGNRVEKLLASIDAAIEDMEEQGEAGAAEVGEAIDARAIDVPVAAPSGESGGIDYPDSLNHHEIAGLEEFIRITRRKLDECGDLWKENAPDVYFRNTATLLACELMLRHGKEGAGDGYDPLSQPEFPALKNIEERKDFINGYASWPVWCRNEKAGEAFHRFNLPDASAIVVKEYMMSGGDRYPDYACRDFYLITPETKHFHDGLATMTALVEHLTKVRQGLKKD